MSPIPRLSGEPGLALLSYGFRPFFLFGAFYAALSVLVWLPMFEGTLGLASAFSAPDWHVHEMLYGYMAAVITGFLLTAIPNWTGRLPLSGRPLLVLVLVWLAGRVAVWISADIGWLPAAIIDVAFLVLVLAAAGREIVAGKNWRNLRVLVIVALFAIANGAFHVEAHLVGTAAMSHRFGLAAVVMLVVLIGGRIIPSFTRNWLARENPGRLPAPFDRVDAFAVGLAAVTLAAWVVSPAWPGTPILMIGAGLFHALRLARWAGDRCLRDPLVLILHVGYGFIPAGFVLIGCAAFLPALPETAGIHALSVGAIGTMTLAVMTRATRGHTGRALVAPPSTQLIYLAVVAAAVLRVLAALPLPGSEPMLWVAGLCWAGAFLGFCFAYGPMILTPRKR
jgi:uncharacterized protein involved in response to NO